MTSARKDAGFDVDTNIVTLLFPDGRKIALEKMSKLDVAEPRAGRGRGDKKRVRSRSPGSEVESQLEVRVGRSDFGVSDAV